jgi:hypothetical protein
LTDCVPSCGRAEEATPQPAGAQASELKQRALTDTLLTTHAESERCGRVRDAEVHAGPATHPRMNLGPSMRAVRTKRMCLHRPLHVADSVSKCDMVLPHGWCGHRQLRVHTKTPWCKQRNHGANKETMVQTKKPWCKQRNHGLVLLLLSYSVEQQRPTWLDRRPPVSQRTLAYMYRAAHRPSVAASSSSSTSSPSCAPSSCMPTRSQCGARQLGGAEAGRSSISVGRGVLCCSLLRTAATSVLRPLTATASPAPPIGAPCTQRLRHGDPLQPHD